MHAILGYAASELIHSDSSLVSAAMNHRIKAIKAIKKRLGEASRTDTNYEEANALVATCFALTFQSVSLEDGLAEYMTFIRGIVIVSMQMAFRGITHVFPTLFEDEQNRILAPQMVDLPLIEKAWVDSAVEALEKLRPLFTLQVEIEYHDQLMGIAQKLYINSFDGMCSSTFLHPCLRRHTDIHTPPCSIQDKLETVRMVDAAAARHLHDR